MTATAARPVTLGECWAFHEHRTQAEVAAKPSRSRYYADTVSASAGWRERKAIRDTAKLDRVKAKLLARGLDEQPTVPVLPLDEVIDELCEKFGVA